MNSEQETAGINEAVSALIVGPNKQHNVPPQNLHSDVIKKFDISESSV